MVLLVVVCDFSVCLLLIVIVLCLCWSVTGCGLAVDLISCVIWILSLWFLVSLGMFCGAVGFNS